MMHMFLDAFVFIVTATALDNKYTTSLGTYQYLSSANIAPGLHLVPMMIMHPTMSGHGPHSQLLRASRRHQFKHCGPLTASARCHKPGRSVAAQAARNSTSVSHREVWVETTSQVGVVWYGCQHWVSHEQACAPGQWVYDPNTMPYLLAWCMRMN